MTREWGIQRYIAIILIATTFALSACATSPSVASASAQFNKSKFSEAFIELKSIAENGGSAEADLDLAYFYALGIGTDSDIPSAKMWAQKASVSDPAGAEVLLGDIAEWLEQDPTGALEHYEKAAAIGNSDAFVSLAYIYDRGLGVAVNKATAQAWLLKLDNGGHTMPAEYFTKASDMVSDIESYPPSPRMMQRYGSLTVSFHYIKSGQASDVKIEKSFGSLKIDLMALRSTYMAKMPEPPSWAIAKGITKYSFVMVVQMGPKNH